MNKKLFNLSCIIPISTCQETLGNFFCYLYFPHVLFKNFPFHWQTPFPPLFPQSSLIQNFPCHLDFPRSYKLQKLMLTDLI